MPFGYVVKTHWFFFFAMVPLQASVSVYLFMFEFRKYWKFGNWLSVQGLIVGYNFAQILLPLLNLFQYLSPNNNEDQKLIDRTI